MTLPVITITITSLSLKQDLLNKKIPLLFFLWNTVQWMPVKAKFYEFLDESTRQETLISYNFVLNLSNWFYALDLSRQIY